MRQTICLIAMMTAVVPRCPAADDPPVRKSLIEFGWDEPDTAFLRVHLAEMEETPFDGCVFHANAVSASGKVESFTWLPWGKHEFRDQDLRQARADLLTLRPARFTKNFLRFNTTPGDLDWFDDYSSILANAKLAASLARDGKCAGILLDTEQYEKPLFEYSKQRDAKSKTWDDYARQARIRGREVMTAFQAGYPDLTIVLTFGHTLPWVKSEKGRKLLAETECGLLAPFLDGMVDAATGNTKIIDGFEMSYGYKTRDQFEKAREMTTKGVLEIVADPKKYARTVSPGFGLWLDNDWRTHGWNLDDPGRNYFTPETFRSQRPPARLENHERNRLDLLRKHPAGGRRRESQSSYRKRMTPRSGGPERPPSRTDVAAYAKIFRTTVPATSVSRKSRP